MCPACVLIHVCLFMSRNWVYVYVVIVTEYKTVLSVDDLKEFTEVCVLHVCLYMCVCLCAYVRI
jgi:hypothetical protein